MTENKQSQIIDPEEVLDAEKNQKDNDLEEMKKAGLHYGHKRTYNHPRADYFTLKSSAEIALIDLNETKKGLQAAIDFIKEIIKNKGMILFVGTTGGAQKAVEELSKKHDFPYVINRWLGGTLTNFQTLSDRIKHLQELEEKQKSGEWSNYTKQEKKKLEEEIYDLEQKFIGLKNMSRLPDALFVVDPKIHKTAIREAQKKEIPIISILDTDDDPTKVNYPIPANDSAKSSIEYILSKIDAIIEKP